MERFTRFNCVAMRHSCNQLIAAPTLSRLFFLFVFLLFISGKFYAQTVQFTLQPANQTPVLGGDVGFNATPALTDLNGDGRLDCVSGNEVGQIQVFINQLVVSNIVFNPAPTNPFAGVDVGSNSAPTFVDIDGDGDEDCFIGSRTGAYFYFRRGGPAANPFFTPVTGAGNPLNGLNSNGNGYSTPAFADVDGDGDFDCLSGRRSGTFRYFRNDGTATAPVFVAANFPGPNDPTVLPDLHSTPDFVDFEKDGSLDLIAGSNQPYPMRFFPDLDGALAIDAPYNLDNPSIYVNATFFAIAFGDIDGDEDEDCFVGMRDGRFRFVENTTCNEPPIAYCVPGFTIQLDEDGSVPVIEDDFNDASETNCFPLAPYLVDASINIDHIDCMNIPSTIVVLTVQDGLNKLTDTCHVTVTVEDNIAPIVRCIEEYEVLLDANGLGSLDLDNFNPADLDDGSTDNCTANQDLYFEAYFSSNNQQKSSQILTFDCEDIGSTNFDFLLYAYDEYDNGSLTPCTTSVVIADRMAPTGPTTLLPILLDVCQTGNTPVNFNTSINPVYKPTITDNCNEAPTATATPVTSAGMTLGNNTIVWTYTDSHGNTATKTQTVVVSNNAPPTFTNCPPNITVNTPATVIVNGVCGSIVNWTPEPVPFSACSPSDIVLSTLSKSKTPGSFFPEGTQTVTYSVEDNGGNIGFCNFTVTVAQGPVFTPSTLPSRQFFTNTTGTCGATYSPPSVSANDVCDGTRLVSVNYPANYFFAGPTGANPASYTVTYTATDSKNNSSTMSFPLTVADNKKPLITCPNTTSLINTDPSACTASITLSKPPVSDDCSAAGNISVTIAEGMVAKPLGVNTFTIGSHLLTYTATDIAGNTQTCSYTITVQDKEAPVWTGCPNSFTVTAAPNSCTAAGGWMVPSASDLCTAPTSVLTQPAMVSPTTQLNEGANVIRYIATDGASNTSTCSFTVTVVNSTPPVPVCSTLVVRPAANNLCSYAFTGTFWPDVQFDASAIGCDSGSTFTYRLLSNNNLVSVGEQFPVGDRVLRAMVTDVSGNTATCSFTLRVRDGQAPIASNCPQPITVDNATGQCGANVSWTAPTFTDNCPGNSLIITTTNQPGSFFPKGTTTVTYAAKDAVSGGNTGYCVFNVIVNDKQKPTLNCPTVASVNTSPNTCSATVSWALPTFTDNCTPTSGTATTYSPTLSGYTANSSTASASFGLGSTVVTYAVTDAAGNTGTCSFTVVVNDRQAPTITGCPAAPITRNITTGCSEIVAMPPAGLVLTAVDNCPAPGNPATYPVVLNSTLPSGNNFPTGTTLVRYISTDNNGNTATCSFNVVIRELVAPTISKTTPTGTTCSPATVTINTDATNCGKTVTQAILTAPAASDNCPGNVPVTSNLSVNGTLIDLIPANGIPNNITVLWTATDASGNTATCNQTVQVADQLVPVITCPPAIVFTTAQQNCGMTRAEINDLGGLGTATATDNCTPSILLNNTNDAPVFFQTGTTTVTYSSTDLSNNTGTCIQSVRVRDNVNPSITCPAPVTIQSSNGNCSASNVNLGAPTVGDNCQNLSVSNNAPQTYQAGTALVTWTATDAGGNTAICAQQVTVTSGSEICGNFIDDDCDGQIDEGCSGGGNTDPCQVQLLAADGAIRDSFGFAGVIKDDVAAIGAPADDKPGAVNAGAVYLRYIDQGGAGVWGEFKKIIASDGATSDMFGASVDLDGDILVVGAPQDDSKGSIYLFGRNVGGADNWGQIAKFASPGAIGDRFGTAVGINGDFIVVGAPLRDLTTPARTDAGAAFVYRFNGSSWVFYKELNASDALTSDRFGSAVAISDDNIVVGAPLSDPASIASAGAAYVFRQDLGGANNWGQQKKLVANLDVASDEQFGYSVSISGSNIAVGAYRDGYASITRPGSVYMYSRDLGGANNWGVVKRITPFDAWPNDNFGFSVSIDGSDLLVGSRFDDDNGSNAGSAYHYAQNEGGANNWGFIEKILAGDGVLNDNFGQFVSYYDGVYLVGSARDDIGNNLDQGSAYILTDCASAAKQVISEDRGAPVFESGAVRCFPNPFSDVINVDVNLNVEENLLVTVTDATGRQVATLFSGLATPENRYQWNAGSFNGGMYFIRVESESVRKVVPVVLIK